MKVAFLNVQDSVSALGHALKAYFHIEPVLFHPDWHPIRVVRKWVLLRIVIEVVYQAENDTQVRSKLDKYQIEWPAVALRLLKEIMDAEEKGFGQESKFAAEVKRFQQNEIPQGAYGGMEMEDQSSTLRRMADELVE